MTLPKNDAFNAIRLINDRFISIIGKISKIILKSMKFFIKNNAKKMIILKLYIILFRKESIFQNLFVYYKYQ